MQTLRSSFLDKGLQPIKLVSIITNNAKFIRRSKLDTNVIQQTQIGKMKKI